MNPPFTRDSLRHDQFSADDERRMKAREKRIFRNRPVHLSGNSGPFIMLADFMRKSGGKIAAILPLVISTNASSNGVRQYVGNRYHVEFIVTSHDPERIYFSENTSIGEMLLVCRAWDYRNDPKPPTKVVNLARNPATPADALVAAWTLERSDDAYAQGLGTVQEISHEEIASGDWGAVQFLSPALRRDFMELKNNEIAPTLPLSAIAQIGPAGQGVRGVFNRRNLPDADEMTALWDHKTDVTQSMLAKTDAFIAAKPGKQTHANRLWEQRGSMMLPTRMRLNTIRAVCVRLDARTLGSAWVPCKPNLDGVGVSQDDIEKAVCAYLNSSIGVLALLGNRSNRAPSYPNISIDDMRKLLIPDFAAVGPPAAEALAAAYDDLCEKTLLPLPQMNADPVRAALDGAVCAALGVDPNRAADIRRRIAAEPSVTGKRYAGPA